MKKYLFLLLSPVLCASIMVDSTEIPLSLSNQEKYRLTYKTYQTDFQSIPLNPNVYQTVNTYKDSNLTQPASTLYPNSAFTITSILVNDKTEKVFQLDNGLYIAADSSLVFDDKILKDFSVDQTYWLKKNFTVYSSPISNIATKKTTTYQSYQPVHITRIVETPVNTFAELDHNSWVLMDDLSEIDNRMEAVQELLNQKYHLENISVYVKQLSTNQTAGIHQEKQLYAASISKLPVLYYTQKMMDDGHYQLTDSLRYIQEVTSFKGSYSPEGSGSLSKTADGQEYQIRDLIDRTAKLSDNAASNLLAYYVTNQFDDKFYQTITDITGERWDMQNRLASSQMAGLMMEAIYDQGGYVLESLKGTNFDNQRIARDIPVPVAHKIGDAYDVKHDVAIVYTTSPFVLSIFTDQSDYDTISAIANDIYEILK